VKLYCECGAKQRWGTNPKTGKRQPFDFEPDVRGNRTLDEPGDPLPEGHTGPWMPHHATCPLARKFRRR
jgi:hypothetical protein